MGDDHIHHPGKEARNHGIPRPHRHPQRPVHRHQPRPPQLAAVRPGHPRQGRLHRRRRDLRHRHRQRHRPRPGRRRHLVRPQHLALGRLRGHLVRTGRSPDGLPQDLPYRPLDFSEGAGIDRPESEEKNTVKRIWQLTFGPGRRVWAGVEPTSLWTSDDGGQTFTFNRALWDHPQHETWASGAGGAAVHTIVPDPTDPDALTVAISSGGIYQTADDGRTWNGVTKGITVDYAPDEAPESGQCIHKVTRDAEGTLYVQSHGPAYRSTRPDGGWQDMSENLPTKFGFAIVAHPSEPGAVMAWPCSASMERTPPDRQVGPWRSDDGGDTWSAWGTGLPTDAYFGGVLRDGACTDGADDPGWYFGTRCGDVWAAAESDGRWHTVAAHLPDVLCVRAMETA
ncbi:hypothetical protein GCM10029992_44530 [Glycomyces albus]